MANELKQIEHKIAEQLKAECGVTVEFTLRSDDQFTINGKPDDVQIVSRHLQAAPYNWIADGDPQYDAECDEQFVYLRKPH